MGENVRGRMISAPERQESIELIEKAMGSGAVKKRACEIMGISIRTYQRWKGSKNPLIDKRTTCERKAPANKLTGDERRRILEISNTVENQDLPPSQIVPRLADKGEYLASESSFYRVLKEEGQQHHRGRSKEPQKRPLATHLARKPNQVYTWDITYLNAEIKGKYYYLYLILDIFSRKAVGYEVWEEESAENASQLIRRTLIREGIHGRKTPLVLHSDNGSPMKGATMLETLYQLGITPSRSRPRVSNDNPYSESMFRTLKYRPNYQPKGFRSLEEARIWVEKFVNWYNDEHHHSGIKFLTPNQRHDGKAHEILKNRQDVYETAKVKHPERWSGKTRNWELREEVWLNPVKEKEATESKGENVIA